MTDLLSIPDENSQQTNRVTLSQHDKEHLFKSLQWTWYYIVKKQTLCLRSIKRQGYPFSPLLFYTVLEILISAIKQEKDTKASRLKRRLKGSINEFIYVKDSMKSI